MAVGAQGMPSWPVRNASEQEPERSHHCPAPRPHQGLPEREAGVWMQGWRQPAGVLIATSQAPESKSQECLLPLSAGPARNTIAWGICPFCVRSLGLSHLPG